METAAVAESTRHMMMMKSNLTLDVGSRAESAVVPDVVLSSPDVRLLQLASPELERLVLQQYGGHQEQYQNQYPHHQQQLQQQQQVYGSQSHPHTVEPRTEYTRGYVDALFQMQSRCDPPPPTTQTPAVDPAPRRRAPPTSGHVTFSSETPPLSPIDLADQDRARLERKRERNRLAATRCRNRKLERIDQLQTQADRLRSDNSRLADDVRRLQGIVNGLRHDVLLHSACQPPPDMPTLAASQFNI